MDIRSGRFHIQRKVAEQMLSSRFRVQKGSRAFSAGRSQRKQYGVWGDIMERKRRRLGSGRKACGGEEQGDGPR